MKCLKAEGLEFDQTSSNRELGDLYDSIKGRVTEVCVGCVCVIWLIYALPSVSWAQQCTKEG